jgi:hypothetical protein
LTKQTGRQTVSQSAYSSQLHGHGKSRQKSPSWRTVLDAVRYGRIYNDLTTIQIAVGYETTLVCFPGILRTMGWTSGGSGNPGWSCYGASGGVVVVALADRDCGGVVMRASGLSPAEVARTGFLTPNGGTVALSATLGPLSAIRRPLPATLF